VSGQIPVVSDIRFHPINPSEKGLIGFVSLLYAGLWLKDIAVYTLRHPTDKRQFRLVYPRNKATNRNTYHPINEDTSKMIEQEVNSYLAVQLQKGEGLCES